MIRCEFENAEKANLRHVVVHCLCIKDNKILLVKRAEGILEAGKWGFPGGFLDQGENIKVCATRELMEETGYSGEVNMLFRVNSHPNRTKDNGRNNVAFEFLVSVGEKTGEPDWEQTEVGWHNLEDLKPEEMAFDHGQTIKALIEYQKNQFELPIVV